RQHGINSRAGWLRGSTCLLCIQGWCRTTDARGGFGLRQSRDSHKCCMPWRHSYADGRASRRYGSRGGPHCYGANRQDGQARRGCRSCRVVVLECCGVCHWHCDAARRRLGCKVSCGMCKQGEPSSSLLTDGPTRGGPFRELAVNSITCAWNRPPTAAAHAPIRCAHSTKGGLVRGEGIMRHKALSLALALFIVILSPPLRGGAQESTKIWRIGVMDGGLDHVP